MQACGLSSSRAGQPALLADLLCARALGDFSDALIESMLGAQPATSTKNADGKRVAGKHDPKVESESPSSDADEATSAATVITANLQVPVAPNPIPLADPALAAPHVETSAATIEGEVSARMERATQAKVTAPDLHVRFVAAAAEISVRPSLRLSAVASSTTAQDARMSRPETKSTVQTVQNSTPAAALSLNQQQPAESSVPAIVPLEFDSVSSTQPLPDQAVENTSLLAAISEDQRQPPNSTLPAVVSFEGDSTLPAQLLPVSTEGAPSARSAIAPWAAPNESNSTLTSAPEVPEQSLQAAPAQANPIATSEASATTEAKTFQAGPDKTRSTIPALGDEIRSAVSRAAQAHGQIFAESAGTHATLRATPAERGGSKDASEKKISVAPAQERPSSHETQGSLVRDDGVTAVVPREMASVAPPPTDASSAETREVPKNPQMPDSIPAADSTLPAARVATDASGEVQMRVGMRTAAFGAVEIYTSVHQNQVGIAVHGEREMAHWFGGEVQNLESGLKDHHLHLSTMEMEQGGAGLQTSTGSQQQNPQRNFQAMRGWPVSRAPEREKVERVEAVPAGLPVWSVENRVSIRI